MKYNSEQIKELAEKVDLVEYIGKTEELHRRGDCYVINCPFHKDDNDPSLSIRPSTNRWHCFGCGATGNIFDWIQAYEGKTFPEALEQVCEMLGEEPEEYIESETVAYLKQQKKQQMKIKKSAEQPQRTILDFTEDYLYKFSDELPQEWLDEDMTEEALRHYNIMIDPNANRIVYPVFDADGNFIGVKGRTRLKEYKALKLSKYMNYHKVGTIDYFAGYVEAADEIKREKSVIIFEGIKSCIKAYGWGIRNTMASETSALSEGQLRFLIRAGIPEVIFGWDNEERFQDIATDTNINILKRFTKVSVIYDRHRLLPELKMAPVDAGKEVFERLLKERIKL